MAPVFNIAVLIYPGADILDFSGPIEVYSVSLPDEEKSFKITTFSHHNPVTAAGDVLTYIPMASVSDVSANLENFDILVIPGAWPEVIHNLIATQEGKELTALIKKFSELPSRQETGKRVVQSVCTGAMLLAASGILAGRTVTTHHIAYDDVKKLADEAAGGESNTKVVSQRWVDAGTTSAGVRIVNAAGVTSGLDATLYIIEELVGKKLADTAAEIVEFARRKQEDAWGS